MESPAELVARIPLSAAAAAGVAESRAAVGEALRGRAGRFLVLVGPCSIHDPAAALEYGQRLRGLADRLGPGGVLLAMRAYVEKSRTALGWRGLAEEPGIDGRRDPEAGAEAARRVLVALAEYGLPLAAEIVSPYLWRYWADCLSWSAIGARGVEAQALRETAAALPFPCGFKNDLAGSHDSALAAALVASKPCRFLGLGPEGRVAAIEAPGNPLPHLVLRGGRLQLPFSAGWSRPNYLAASSAIRDLEAAGLEPALVVDASHDNRRPFGQAFTARAALRLARSGKSASRIGIRGLMLESNLEPGCQAPAPLAGLRYGVSITDPCLGWEETEALILEIDARLRRRSPA